LLDAKQEEMSFTILDIRRSALFSVDVTRCLCKDPSLCTLHSFSKDSRLSSALLAQKEVMAGPESVIEPSTFSAITFKLCKVYSELSIPKSRLRYHGFTSLASWAAFSIFDFSSSSVAEAIQRTSSSRSYNN
jgi:hypothetical protein